MRVIKEILKAASASRSFQEFFSGVEVKILDAAPISVKVVYCKRAERSHCYRFFRHSFETMVEASNGVRAYGFGESDIDLIAIQKAIAEGVERCVFKLAKNNFPDLKNSNGWAAHLSQLMAQSAAQSELLERDASLLHWLSQTPMQQIALEQLPKRLKNWSTHELVTAQRFNGLKILISHLGFAPIAATFIHDKNDFGFISQATAADLQTAIEKALVETSRIADFFEKGIMKPMAGDHPSTPDDHATYYAVREKIPNWLIGEPVDWKSAAASWKEKCKSVYEQAPAVSFTDFRCGPLHISYCQSSDVQKLYFGSTESALKNGWINLERIKKVCGSEQLCLLPHFVP